MLDKLGSWFANSASAIFENAFMEEDRNQRQMWQVGVNREAMDFSERMASTQYQRGVADLRAAGLNPALAYHQGGAAAPSGVATGSSGGAGANPRLGEAMLMQSQIAVNSAQSKKLEAEASLVSASEAEVRARTPTYEVSIAHMRQQIDESIERVGQIVATAHRQWASAAEAEQRVKNLQEEIPRIRATIKQLESLAAKQDEETKEIRQRIKENLPELQRALGKLEAASRLAGLPERETTGRLYSDPVLGAAATLLRAFNPLQVILGR